MHDTGYDLAGPVIAKRASGYTGTVDHLANATYLDMTLPYAAGSLYSTVEDLLKWDRILYTNELLKPESMKEMYTPFLRDYAYGWVVQMQGTHKTYGHGGGINGFNTFIARYPDDRTLVVVLCNINTNAPGKMGADLAKLSWGEPLEEAKPAK